MTFIQAILLGFVEGITEFLPVSSTAHLILVEAFLKIAETDFVKSFTIAIQLGAIVAVLLLYARRLVRDWRLVTKVLVAFIPTALIGLALHGIVKSYLLGNAAVALAALAGGGVVLILFERWYHRSGREGRGAELERLNYRAATTIGVVQALAIIPGISRSAATIVAGLALGLSREAIVEFSFLLAIPTMAGATALDLLKSGGSFTGYEWFLLVVGFIFSFIFALVSIRWLLRYVRRHSFTSFGIYRLVLALVAWFWIF